MSKLQTLNFHGPLTWTAMDFEDSALYSKVAAKYGVYLWTLKTDKGYLIFYIGTTVRPFGDRMREHLEKQLSGQYPIYVSEQLKRGDLKPYVWRGVYGNTEKKILHQYLERLPELLPTNLDFIRQVMFFVAPLDCTRRQLERMEAAIAQHLRKQEGIIVTALEKFRISPSRKGEEEFDITIPRSAEFLGLPSTIKVVDEGA